MRFVMISLVIIFFSWSMSGVGIVSEEFQNETGRYLYGGYATSQINTTAIGRVGSDAGFNDTLNEMAESASNPPSTPLDTMWGYWTNFIQAINVIYDVLVYPIFHVGAIIQYPMGTKDIQVMSDFWATTITTACYICFLLGLAQIFGRFNLKGGA